MPDETLDDSLVLVTLVEVPKADCHNRWTVGEHRADCKPLVPRTAFHRLEEGTVSALTKLEAALTLRRNLPERHVYDQLSRLSWLVVCTHFHSYWCMMEMHLFWLDIFYLLALCHLGGQHSW